MHQRLNRDQLGGKLKNLPAKLDSLLQRGITDVVLDNTYATIESRAGVIEVCRKHKIDCECVWLDTSIEDAQVNACTRMIQKYGSIFDPKAIDGNDPNIFPIAALYSYRKRFEKPTMAEGFITVDRVKFVRKRPTKYKNKAIILDYDGTLRTSNGPNPWPENITEVNILPKRITKLSEYVAEGYHLLGASNQSAIAKGTLDAKTAKACFERTNMLLGFNIDYMFCPHKVPPITCYCRKPGPAMGVHFIEKYRLDPAQCIMVGDQRSDETFANRCGFQYQDQAEFFS